MSGGSLDYVYRNVADAAQNILERSQNPLHRAFARHLSRVSKALHDLEWVYSGDCSEPDEEAAIRAVLHPPAAWRKLPLTVESCVEHLRSTWGDIYISTEARCAVEETYDYIEEVINKKNK